MPKEIKPFQYISVKQAYEEGRFLIADDMGMFKTAQAILLNNKIRKSKRGKARTLVVAPTSVREHWAREIQDWSYPKTHDISLLTTQNYSSEVLKLKKNDWVITSYSLFSNVDEGSLQRLAKIGFDHIIFDEVHNAKNPEAARTKGVRSLTRNLEHLTLLSGTPVPNTIEDAYMLMHFLEPQNYPLSDDPNDGSLNAAARHWFKDIYWKNPQAFKELMSRKMIRREARGLIGAKLPEVTEQDIHIDINGAWLEIYNRILEPEMPLGRKLMQIEKALTDTRLVDPSFTKGLPNIAPKYDALDEIVAKETRKRGKVLIFTNLKEGVVVPLLERYRRYGAIAITGDVTSSRDNPRERLRMQFQENSATKVMIATTVMNEGVDLTAATAIVNLMLPWTPAERQQRTKRSDRWGEVEKDHLMVYNLLARYPKKIRKSFDEARQDMLVGKQRVVDYLYSGLALTREQLTDFQNPKYVPRIKRALASDNQIVFKYFLNWRGIGTKGALRRLKRNPNANQETAEMYAQFNMARNAARLYLPIIEDLNPAGRWLDLAGGPGMLGYFAEKPVHVLDISHNYLKEGRRLNTGHHVNASFSAVPYAEGNFGLVVCSLAFQMSEPKIERAQVLHEMNRVLTEGGYGILILPVNYTTMKDRQKFESALNLYGFESIKKYHGLNLGPSKLELYAVRKIGEPDSKIRDLTFQGDRVVGR